MHFEHEGHFVRRERGQGFRTRSSFPFAFAVDRCLDCPSSGGVEEEP